MRLGSVTLSAALSAVLLSGCSFIGGQPGQYKNPFAKQKAASQGHYGQQGHYAQRGNTRCQVLSPSHPIPRGCRPEEVTLAVAPQKGAYGGFPQEPQFGQTGQSGPTYADGAFGTAVGQQANHMQHKTGPKLKKPRLRGSLSLGVEKSVSGSLIDYGIRDDLDPVAGYDPQVFNEGRVEGGVDVGGVTTTTWTANDRDVASIFTPNSFESADRPTISYDDAWSTPARISAGLEYILNDKLTVFANGGYTHAEGESGDVASVTATVYQQVSEQALDGTGAPIGAPVVNTTYIPNQQIASFAYDFTDQRQYDLEVGARHYFDPIVKSQGYRTVTPFVGASVGASHVNAVDVSVSQTQAYYNRFFNDGDETEFYSVAGPDNTTRLYDSQWLPQGQLNVGAEWQVTPGFALAAESGVRVQGAREYADFTNAAGDIVQGAKGDTNVSIPFTLRGSVNF